MTDHEQVEARVALLSHADRSAFEDYRWRGVYVVKRNDPDYRLYNACYRYAESRGWPWVKVRLRRKYASVTVDLISTERPREPDPATWDKCVAVIDRAAIRGRTHLVGGPACFTVDPVSAHRAGNLADLLLAIARKSTS